MGAKTSRQEANMEGWLRDTPLAHEQQLEGPTEGNREKGLNCRFGDK